ncbi:hypothetical protein MKX08_006230 [Trichoderma sp. CBMAI-0020]|nr:hypothetical protein MKX08_006230 [Trichoderma sp. CBMAI-0020]
MLLSSPAIPQPHTKPSPISRLGSLSFGLTKPPTPAPQPPDFAGPRPLYAPPVQSFSTRSRRSTKPNGSLTDSRQKAMTVLRHFRIAIEFIFSIFSSCSGVVLKVSVWCE